jgi:hypothetical protein
VPGKATVYQRSKKAIGKRKMEVERTMRGGKKRPPLPRR